LKNQNQGIANSGYFKNLEELCILMKEPVVYGRLLIFQDIENHGYLSRLNI
jgi:hypothetical protein